MKVLEKNGVEYSSLFQENNFNGSQNFFGGFSNYNSGSYTVSNGEYTITSPVTSSSWGSGVSLNNGYIIVPYGCDYRASIDVLVPTAHTIVIDHNNSVPSGITVWSGNDNDNTSKRTRSTFSIPANTWTTITWGSNNSHASNTNKVDISIYDGIGLVTSADTATVTWKIKNPRVYIGYVGENLKRITSTAIYSNNFYEI